MGRRGESSREQAKRAILLFAADQKKHTRPEFIEELVEKKAEFAKNTVYKYMDELVTDKLMKIEPGSPEDSFKPVYSITELGSEKVDRIESHNFIDSFETKWLSAIKNMLSGLLSKFKEIVGMPIGLWKLKDSWLFQQNVSLDRVHAPQYFRTLCFFLWKKKRYWML